MKRKIVCLCGSTRFSQAFHGANPEEWHTSYRVQEFPLTTAG